MQQQQQHQQSSSAAAAGEEGEDGGGGSGQGGEEEVREGGKYSKSVCGGCECIIPQPASVFSFLNPPTPRRTHPQRQPQQPPPRSSYIPLAAAIDTMSLHYRRPSLSSPSSSNSSGAVPAGLMGRIQSFAAANHHGSRTAAAPTTADPTAATAQQAQQGQWQQVIWLRGGFFDAGNPLVLVPPVAPAALGG